MATVLRTDLDLAGFFAALARAPTRTLIFDYDGTLAPFRTERDQAFPYPGVRDTLTELMAAGHTHVVLISGRPIDDIIPLLNLPYPPELWGNHGWERRMPDGRRERAALPERSARGLKQALQHARVGRWMTSCEDKPFSLALHWRGRSAEDVRRLREQALTVWQPLCDDGSLVLRGFDGGLELRPPEIDKGTAVRSILTELGPDGVVGYAGDDSTDEDAFAALAECGLKILVRPELRPTRADLWLKPPEELIGFVQSWMRACEDAR